MLVKSQVKYIQSLGQKRQRDEDGVFIAEGPRLVGDLLAAVPAQFVELYASPSWLSDHSALIAGIKFHEVDDTELERLSQLTTPNQVVAIIRKFVQPAAIDIKERIVLALDTIQDPGNLGTIIRIADWFGINQVVCSHECADMYNPKVVQATMGSIARVKMIYTGLDEWLTSGEELNIFATALEGTDIKKVGRINEGVIVIGNEAKGISPGILALSHQKITIPRKGQAESLNAAVATGIILSHVV